MISSVNILFTSAGRRVELLRAFRRAYKALNLQGRIIALDMDPLAPAFRVADQIYLVPRLTSPDYISRLIDICRTEDVKVIFPLIDPDIPVLAGHSEEIEATGARMAVVRGPAVSIVSDKWETVRFFEKISLDVPHTWLPEQINPGSMEYPLFIKPRGGSAAQNTFRVNNPKEMAFFLEYVPDPVVQEFLSGPEITSDVICDLQGQVLAVVSRKRIEVRWGEVAKGVTVFDNRIIEGCVRIAQQLPACGPITVQCILKNGSPYFTEINARYGGGAPLGIAAGVDSPRILLAKAAGLPVEVPPLGSYQTGLYMTRFDDSFFLTESETGEVESSRF